MGLFGGKKTYVSSVAYNLAGDELKRPNFLKTNVISSIILSDDYSVGDMLRNSYLNGPGIKLRTFYKWALSNYDAIGVPTGFQIGSVDGELISEALVDAIPHTVDETISVATVETGKADYSYWADLWMIENHPDLLDTEWFSDYNETTGQIIITFDDESIYSFSPSSLGINFDLESDYIYASYTIKDLVTETRSAIKIFIYEVGSGNTELDSYIINVGDNGGYFPFIPIRLDNHFISETHLPEIYDLAKRAYKKATNGGKFDEIVEKIADNESLDEIDYAYIMYGVSLNVLEQAGRKYIYDFFKNIMINQSSSQGDYDQWVEDNALYLESLATWQAWNDAQEDPEDPLYGSPEPELIQGTPPPISSIRISSKGTGPYAIDTDFDINITWNYIKETTGSGLLKPEATKDELWFEALSGTQEIVLNWQVTESSWRSLNIVGMKHRNYIYKGKYVEITAVEALEDEDESGFIIPLHYETLRQMSLIDSTQISTCCTFVVFNSYKVVKQKWYQTGIFKIIQIVLVIAVSIIAGPLAGGALQAIFLATTGFDGTIFSFIFGKGLSAVLTLVLIKILSVVAEPIFGEKLGRAISTVGAIIIMSIATDMASGASFTEAFNQTFSLSASNIITLTSAVGQGVAVYIGVGISNIIQANLDLIEKYEKEMERISQLYQKNIGIGLASIDPFMLTDAGYVVIEREASFLERTLLTGSDISEMTMKLVHNFSDINLNLPLPDQR